MKILNNIATGQTALKKVVLPLTMLTLPLTALSNNIKYDTYEKENTQLTKKTRAQKDNCNGLSEIFFLSMLVGAAGGLIHFVKRLD